MNKRIAVLGLLVILSTTIYSQDASTQSKDLTERVKTLYQQGNFVEAIKAAESLVKLEKDSTDSASYVNALINLARIKRDYFVSLQNRLISIRATSAERREIGEATAKNANEAEALFREALQLNEASGKEQTAQTADLKRDLAWLVYHHAPSDTNTIEKSRARIDEAEKLFLDAIALNEQVRGKDADETLFVALDAGDFYYHYVNFEKALPFYERFIQTYEQKHGPNQPELVRALRPHASILATTFQDQEASAVIDRIVKITQQKEAVPNGNLNLHLRSKDSVAFSATVIQRFNREMDDYRYKRELVAERSPSKPDSYPAPPRMIIVPVKVEIDENGKVIKAVAETNDAGLRAKAETEVSKWSVRPFSYNGTTRKMRGILSYREIR
jgi:tetratricopeptide (TPR) repeat protein